MFSLDTSNESLRSLLANGLTYRVPRFQRDYSWTPKEWEDLWLDVQGVLVEGTEPHHYMGYLVLQSRDRKTFEVIDGQQRLTTLSILVLAALDVLGRLEDDGERSDNDRRAATLRSNFIGYTDPVSLASKPKLQLNRRDDAFFQDKLIPLRPPKNKRGLRQSERAMLGAFEWFHKVLTEHFGPAAEGRAIAEFVEGIADKLFFTAIKVSDELNAFKVFETLNARGVRLSATDLLKNYLFSVVTHEETHQSDLDTLERRWETIVGKLGAEDFPEFLRVWWNSRNRLTRANELFRAIRQRIADRGEAFHLIEELENDVDDYLGLRSPDEHPWTEDDLLPEAARGSIQRSLTELRMFNVRQPISMLLAARRHWSAADFDRMCRSSSVMALRINVIGSGDSSLESRYNRIAVRISLGELQTFRDAAPELAQHYPSDDTFRAQFERAHLVTTSARNRKIVQYLLHALERQSEGLDYDYQSSRNTIEHVLPESPGDDWDRDGDESIDAFIYRLGNLTVLEKGLNHEAGNAGFSTKRLVYRRSNFVLTRSLADDYAEWTARTIAERQRKMARLASSIWSISFPG